MKPTWSRTHVDRDGDILGQRSWNVPFIWPNGKESERSTLPDLKAPWRLFFGS